MDRWLIRAALWLVGVAIAGGAVFVVTEGDLVKAAALVVASAIISLGTMFTVDDLRRSRIQRRTRQ